MDVWITSEGGSPSGELTPPGDKSISHRALLVAGLARGASTVFGALDSADVAATVGFVRAIGATIEGELGDRLVITSPGRMQLHEAIGPLEVHNSGTLIRLGCGVLAGIEGHHVIFGDASINSRPMLRVVAPLRRMGAIIDGREGGKFAPLAIRGAALGPIDYTLPVPSAQVKSAILLAGLACQGKTVVRERIATRPHTEELLGTLGVCISTERATDGSSVVTLDGGTELNSFSMAVPGDPSSVAFFVAAAAAIPDATITVHGLYGGETRTGYLRVLERMGAKVVRTVVDVGLIDLTVTGAQLRGTTILPEEVPDLVDEVPALAVAFALAVGRSKVSGAGELRVKESDRIATTSALLRAFGCEVSEFDDGFDVTGLTTLSPPRRRVDARGDHRIVMAAATLGAIARGATLVTDAESVKTSYPRFFSDLEQLVVCGVSFED
ncbi:MAG: 3-phosphoshikimate 1-carboxyvinyltransferase [Ferrimicrobium sp.]